MFVGPFDQALRWCLVYRWRSCRVHNVSHALESQVDEGYGRIPLPEMGADIPPF